MRLQFVLGSHSAFVHPATGASNWIAEGQVGRGRGWALAENERRRGRVGEKEGWARRNKGDGEQGMQRQSRKRSRLMTLHRDTDKVEGEEKRGEEADFDGPPCAVYCISKMAAHH